MSTTTPYVLRTREKNSVFVRNCFPGFYSWCGKARDAQRFIGREAAEAAAQQLEWDIVAACGYAVQIRIVPATGGAATTRKAVRT